MKLHDLRPPAGSHTARTRVGRGIAAGKGKTAGRGTKGQKARAGGSIPPWFEGGQTPLHMRIPKLRGFKNPFKIDYEVVNVGAIAGPAERGAFEGGEPERLKTKRQGGPHRPSTRTSSAPSGSSGPSRSHSRSSAPASCRRRCSSSPTRSRSRRSPRSRPPAGRSPSSRSRPRRSPRSVSARRAPGQPREARTAAGRAAADRKADARDGSGCGGGRERRGGRCGQHGEGGQAAQGSQGQGSRRGVRDGRRRDITADAPDVADAPDAAEAPEAADAAAAGGIRRVRESSRGRRRDADIGRSGGATATEADPATDDENA